MEKKVFLNFAAPWGCVLLAKIFIKVMNLMSHLSSICESYKFEFLFIEWRISCPYTWKTWRYYIHHDGIFGVLVTFT